LVSARASAARTEPPVRARIITTRQPPTVQGVRPGKGTVFMDGKERTKFAGGCLENFGSQAGGRV